MVEIDWNSFGGALLESGVDRGVLYANGIGVPWMGLISVTEKTHSPGVNRVFKDALLTDVFQSVGSFAATIAAYTYPDELEDYGLSFGLSYRTQIQNGSILDYGYKIHLVYNAVIPKTTKTYDVKTLASSFTWDIETTPIRIRGTKPSAHFVVDSTKTNPQTMRELEDLLYGTETTQPQLPTRTQLLRIFGLGGLLEIIDLGNGYFTAEGPDDMVQLIDEDHFTIEADSVVIIDEDYFTVESE